MNRKAAVITGATSGIGAAFAKKFASQNYNLIITGRREEKIKAFAHKLMEKYNVTVEVIIVELSDHNALNMLVKKIQDMKNLDILVNNAGFTKRSKFSEENISAHEDIITTHCIATMKLTYAALPNMIANRKGAIINVSSIMGFFPFYMQPMYTATKAFVGIFTESLNLELKGTGVKAQALCPGLTYSDLHEKLGLDVEKLAQKKVWLWRPPMKPEAVVKKSLKCLEKNKVLCIPGVTNKLITILYNLKRFF